MDSCPQGAELRFLSDRCFLKDKIMPEPLGRLADLVWAPTDFLELTALGATILNPLNQTSGKSVFDIVSGSYNPTTSASHRVNRGLAHSCA